MGEKKYKEYYDVAINEKQQQYDAMMLLKTYLDEVIKKEKNVNKMKVTSNIFLDCYDHQCTSSAGS